MSNAHLFRIGQLFAVKQANAPSDYLAAALQAERFIAAHQQETPEGIYWSLQPDAPLDQTFYSGTAGILYFYLKLTEVTGEAQYSEIAEKATNYLALHWQDFLSAPPTLGLGTENGLYFGLGGLGLVLGEAYRTLGNQRAAEAAHAIVTYYQQQAKTDENGAYWTGSTALALDGGVILLLLQQYQLFPNEAVKALIQSAGLHYLKSGKKRIGGGIEYNGFAGLAPINLPNFEFGTSGSGYLLTLLYQFTGDEAYLNAAKGCTEYLAKLKVKQLKGYLIPHDVDGPGDPEPVFYVSSCHGPAGTSKLYYQLYRLTGEAKWFDEIVQLVDGLESLGVPEQQSAGLWNNVCLCCGHAGLVQFFVGLYQADGDPRWRDLAVRTANVLLGEKEDLGDGSANWPLAWERIKPENITTPLGYYDGAAGIGSALLQIYLSESGNFHWSRLIDDPFPAATQFESISK
jgi:lantibiotic modifying enzyme